MREIKFRAWYNDSDEMGEVDDEIYCPQMIYDVQNLYDGSGPSENTILGAYGSFGSLLDDKNFNIMQYTGLKDKHGKEIYEGDVLYCDSEGMRGDVVFKHGSFMTNCFGWGDTSFSDINNDDVEVIGNIHQHPELLDK